MSARVRSILSEPIRHHMRSNPATLKVNQNVAEALQHIRENPPSGRVIYFYVVDNEGRLMGVAPTRRLLLSSPIARIEQIMIKPVISLPETATVLDACEFFTMHKLLAFPVVDGEKKLLGMVDVELYTGEIQDLEENWEKEDVFQLIGVQLDEVERNSVPTAVRKRFPWLICNIIGGLLAAVLADVYSDVATLAVVTPFIPVVLTLAESVAIQSVSLAIQSLHGRRPTWAMLLPTLTREALVGISLGVLCGLSVGIIAAGWKGTLWVGISLMCGIAGGVAAAAVIGMAMPILLKLLQRDPSVASGPIALASADMATLLVYFNIVRLMIQS